MTSGNAAAGRDLGPGSTSGNTAAQTVVLPPVLAAALVDYEQAVASAPLAPGTRRKYVARVRGYLRWLADADPAELGADPDAGPQVALVAVLDEPAARDGAVRDWRAWAKTIGRHRATTINNTLAAVDDFYRRRGAGAATARREALPRRAPRALNERQVVRYLRGVERCGSARDTVVALLPFYAGLRVGEVAGLDVDDVALSARKGMLRVRGKGRDGGKLRELPISRPELRAALSQWLTERADWAGADTSPALLLNRRGGRLSDRSARTIVSELGAQVGLVDDAAGDGFGPHVLRHTFATQLLRAGVDPVLLADLLGHASLDTLRVYTQPTDADRERALAQLTTDG